MRKQLLALAMVLAVAGAVAGISVASNGQMQQYGPYASGSTDSGTCGNDWANDTFNRVYKVQTKRNADGTYNVTEDFKDGSFTTILGPSPGACETNQTGNWPGVTA